MIYGAGGAILTRVGANIVGGFVPASFAVSPLAQPVVQAAVAVIPVRWAGKRFLGQQQGDIMMLGGLISAGLALADAYLPNVQNQLIGVIRAPIATAPQAQLPAGTTAMAGFRDVEEVPDSIFSGGFQDVEDVSPMADATRQGIF